MKANSMLERLVVDSARVKSGASLVETWEEPRSPPDAVRAAPDLLQLVRGASLSPKWNRADGEARYEQACALELPVQQLQDSMSPRHASPQCISPRRASSRPLSLR